MDTKLLKQKILDLAIHGKLVPQNPNDEPASKLLEKIREEKQKLIAEKKIKADKNDSYIFVGDDNRHYEKFADGTVKDIEDEIPFDVPEGWEWCRLGSIIDFINGRAYRRPELLPSGKYRVLRVGNFFTNDSWYYSDLELEDSKYCYEGDLLYAWSASFGPKIWHGDKTIFHYHIWNVKYSEKLLEKMYLYYFFLKDVDTIKESTTGSTMVHVAMENMKPRFIPVPPLEEQKRIVSEIEHSFTLINSLEKDKSDLQTAIKQAKSKILDLAIHGKLVPQDSSDEPASVLLGKIRAEKEAKIKAGELKRDKNDSYIYKNTTDNCHYEKFNGKDPVCIDEEIPFDIPENWQWTKLGRICTKLVDGDHNPPKGIEEKTDYIMASSRNINHNTVEDLENVRYLTKEMFEIENQRTKATEGDIFFTSVGTLGRSCIYDGSLNICFQRSVSILNTQIDKNYLKYFFDSNFYQDYVVEHATGTAQLGFYLQEMSESYIAIPPISEQKRIVSKIEELFERLDQIQNNLI